MLELVIPLIHEPEHNCPYLLRIPLDAWSPSDVTGIRYLSFVKSWSLDWAKQLNEWLPLGKKCWDHLDLESKAGPSYKLYRCDSLNSGLEGKEIAENILEGDLNGRSFEVPLCIAAWALALQWATKDLRYVEAARGCRLSGSLNPEESLKYVDLKAGALVDYDKWEGKFIVRTNEQLALPDELRTEALPTFEQVFERVFRDLPLARYEDARAKVEAEFRTPASPALPFNGLRLYEILARNIPVAKDIKEIADKLKTRTGIKVTATERWSVMERQCREQKRLTHLVKAVADCRPALNWLRNLDGITLEGPLDRRDDMPNQAELAAMVEQVTAGIGRPPLPADEAEIRQARHLIGGCALARVWNDGPPGIERERQSLKQIEDSVFDRTLKSGVRHELWNVDGNFRSFRVALELAADHLARRAEIDPSLGKEVVRWLLDLDQPNPSPKFDQLLTLVLRWWPGAHAVAEEWATALLDSAEEPLSRGETQRVRRLLVRAHQLILEAGVPFANGVFGADGAADPPSVHWAYLTGQTVSIASLLEQLGERRAEVYRHHLHRMWRRGDRPAQVPLARALCRLAEDGDITATTDLNAPLDRVLPLALRDAAWDGLSSLLPDTGRLESDALNWWLDLLPFDPGADQVRMLQTLEETVAALPGQETLLEAVREAMRVREVARKRLQRSPSVVGPRAVSLRSVAPSPPSEPADAADWSPYLRQLLGDDDDSANRILQLLMIRSALSDSSLLMNERVRLLGWIADLDRPRQVFLLPWLLELLADPAASVRNRMLDLVADLVGPCYGVPAALRRLTEKSSPRGEDLMSALRVLSEVLVAEEEAVTRVTAFDQLLDLRRPVFALAGFLGLTRWSGRRPDAANLGQTLAAFFDDPRQAYVRELLGRWRDKGPLFVRFLLVCWMGKTGKSLVAGEDVLTALRRCYQYDGDPLVAGVAVGEFVCRVKAEALGPTLEFLSGELRGLATRDLDWAPGRASAEAVRELTASLLWSLGRLAAEHIDDPRPRELLRECLEEPPADYLSLLDSQLSELERKQIFRAALLGRGQGISIHTADPNGRKVWTVPSRLSPEHDPNRWSFTVTDRPTKQDPIATDLLGCFSPKLPKNVRWPQVEQRGPWVLAGFDAAANVITAALAKSRSPSDPDVRPFFDFLLAQAIVINGIERPDEDRLSYCVRGRNKVVRILLMRLAHREVFDALFAEGLRSNLQKLFRDLTVAALRARPDDPSHSWIADNTSTLLQVALSQDKMALRGAAAIVLRVHAAQEDFPGRDQLDSLWLGDEEVLEHRPDALAFVSNETLNHILVRLTDPERLSLPNDRHARNAVRRATCLHAEVLARHLENRRLDSEGAEQAAARLAVLDHPDEDLSHSVVLRLLIAYGRAAGTDRLQAGPISRFLAHQLGRVGASALGRFFECLPPGPLDDNSLALLTRLIGRASRDFGPLPRRADLQKIRDDLAAGPLLLAQLADRAAIAPDAANFFQRFRRLRQRETLPLAYGPSLSSFGHLLVPVTRPEDEGLVKLTPADQQVSLNGTLGDPWLTFVHAPGPDAPIHCLVRGTPVPEGTIDLHALPLDGADRWSLLARRLQADGTVRLMARVVGGIGLETDIDLGAAPSGQPRRLRVHLEAPPPGTPLLVKVRAERLQERVVTRSSWDPHFGKPGNLPSFDLRTEADPVGRLEEIVSRYGLEFLLHARVMKVLAPVNGSVLCLLGAGFQWLREERGGGAGKMLDPAVRVDEVDAPEPGAEVLFRPCLRPEFNTREAPGTDSVRLQVTPLAGLPVLVGRLLLGSVVATRRGPGGRRQWVGRAGGVELSLERQNLTGDLASLIGYDEMPDDAPALAALAGPDKVCLRVVPGRGGHPAFSVIAAPASWEVVDVLIAVATAQAAGISFLRRERDALVFEVLLESASGRMTSPVGVLARLYDGELFDERGRPLSSDFENKEGERLRLAIGRGRPNTDGSYELSPEGTPFLVVTGRDGSAQRFREDYKAGSVVRVRVVSCNSPRLELAEPTRIGFPPPHVVVDGTDNFSVQYFRDASQNEELEAAVFGTWDPTSDDYRLTVRRPKAVSLSINRDPKAAGVDVRALIELDRGTVRDVGVRVKRVSKGRWVFVANDLQMEPDPLLEYLLPETVHEEDLTWSQRLTVTEVNNWPKKLVGMQDNRAEEILYLKDQERVRGLVVTTPWGHDAQQVGVRWLRERDDDDDLEVSREWPFVPTEQGTQFFNGDILEAKWEAGSLEVWRTHRQIYGSPLGEILTVSKWCTFFQDWARKRRTAVTGTYLGRRSPSSDADWLFVLPPAFIVALPAAAVAGTGDVLRGLQPLERVGFRVGWPVARGQAMLQAEERLTSLLADWLRVELMLEDFWWNRDDGTYKCRLLGPGEFGRNTGLRLRLRDHELPKDRPGGRPRGSLSCMVQKFRLDLPCTPEGRCLPRLVPVFSTDQGPADPTLEEALEQTCRIEDEAHAEPTGGTVGIRLEHYRHNGLLVIDEEEQTWILHTGPLVVDAQWKGQVVVVRHGGALLASLRRLRPLDFTQWMKGLRQTRPGIPLEEPLLWYYGPLTQEQLRECDRSDLAEGKPTDGVTDWVLFEIAAGKSFVLHIDRLKFFGKRFGPKTLSRGDRIDRFQFTELSTEGEPGLDIRGFLQDIRSHLADFTERDSGFLYGQVRLAGDLVILESVSGADYNPDVVRAGRWGRWQRELEQPSTQELAQLRKAVEGENATVYLQFVYADEVRGVLVFRLLALEQVIKQENLVWVRVPPTLRANASNELALDPKVRLDDDGPPRLLVRPLQAPTSRERKEYFIPDNEFSSRRGSLFLFRNSKVGRVYLARVQRAKPGDSEVRLSLREVPERSFHLLLNSCPCQVVVEEVTPEGEPYLIVECRESVHVKVPLERLRLPAGVGKLLPGTVLFLKRVPGACVEAYDLVESNLTFFDRRPWPTILTELWGGPNGRWRRLREEKDLQCNLVGLPQLDGMFPGNESDVELKELLPQRVTNPNDRGHVRLEPGPVANEIVGRLRVGSDGHPVFKESLNGREYPLEWDEVTFREGTSEELSAAARNSRWRNRGNEPEETINRCVLIARLDGGVVSLTALADCPFPPDHLVEQFPPPWSQAPAMRPFVVAAVADGRLVLEIAPGRFAELPLVLLLPLHVGPLRMAWDRLAPGDEIYLERVPGSGEEDRAVFSTFRVVRLRAGRSRFYQVPFITRLRRTPDGRTVLGLPEAEVPAGRICLPGDRLLDLKRGNPSAENRRRTLCEAFELHGSWLVLHGLAAEAKRDADGWRQDFAIGIQVPSPTGSDNPWIRGGKPFPKGTSVRLRVLKLRHDNYQLKEFEFVCETDASSDEAVLVRGEGGRAWPYDVPERGDAALLYWAQTAPRVLGYEDFRTEWAPDWRDPLGLHEPLRLKQWFDSADSPLCVTIENADWPSHTLLLSRRAQFELVMPSKDEMVRARIHGLWGDRGLHVEVLGVPTVMKAERFCVGSRGKGFIDALPELVKSILIDEQERELEVTVDEDGVLCSDRVYALPTGDEADFVVEYVVGEGILASIGGCRVFVPRGELACCRLEADMIPKLFRRNQRLTVSLPSVGSMRAASHVGTRNIRAEIVRLRRATDEPIPVEVIWVSSPEGIGVGSCRSIVRGRSGLLMELWSNEAMSVGQRLPAYVQGIDFDERARPLIKLGSDRQPPRQWAFVQATEPEWAIDSLSPEVLRTGLARLHVMLASSVPVGPRSVLDAATKWAADQGVLEPSPRNLRRALDVLWDHLGEVVGDGQTAGEPVCQFHAAWRGGLALLAGGDELKAPAIAQFAAGYSLLRAGQATEALRFLSTAALDHSVGRFADVWICLAYGLASCDRLPVGSLTVGGLAWDAGTPGGTAAGRLLAWLVRRIWANALYTLAAPLLGPEHPDPNESVSSAWEDALAAGDLPRLEQILSADAPRSAWGLARRLWLGLARQEPARLDVLADQFLDSLRDEQSRGRPVDTRLSCLAALLCFARGDVNAGQTYLVEAQVGDARDAICAFWAGWLRSPNPASMPVDNGGLLHLLWQFHVAGGEDKPALERVRALWEAFRKGDQRWLLEVPPLRVIASLPVAPGEYVRWAEENAVPPHFLPALQDGELK